MPYGRISDRARPLLVLVEGRGTCSSKHAVLVELADEIGLDVRLTLGIFEMSARTHPELTTILERHGLDHVPEAHCYVRHRGRRTKIEVHRRLLAGWIARTAHVRERSLEEIWRVREECIAALGEV